MMTRPIATGALVAALAQRAAADGGDFAPGIAAGVIGSAVVRDLKKRNPAKAQTPPPAKTSSSGGSSANSAHRGLSRRSSTRQRPGGGMRKAAGTLAGEAATGAIPAFAGAVGSGGATAAPAAGGTSAPVTKTAASP